MKEKLVSHRVCLTNCGYDCPENFRKITFSEVSFSILYILEDRIKRIGGEVIEAKQLRQMLDSHPRPFRR
jgi:hypothetical protein